MNDNPYLKMGIGTAIKAILITGSLTLIVIAYTLSRTTLASANSTDISNARSVYPSITGTRIDSCNLCHTSSIPSLNPYGQAYKANGRSTAAFAPIEGIDSDGDGFTNIQEIMALTFPGDASDFPAPSSPTATPFPPAPTPTATSPAPTATSPAPTATSPAPTSPVPTSPVPTSPAPTATSPVPTSPVPTMTAPAPTETPVPSVTPGCKGDDGGEDDGDHCYSGSPTPPPTPGCNQDDGGEDGDHCYNPNPTPKPGDGGGEGRHNRHPKPPRPRHDD